MAAIPVSFTAAGLTTATTAYTSGDMLGTQITIAGATTGAGVGNYLDAIVLEDDSAVIGAIDVYLFKETVTPAADNAANSWSDADAAKSVGIISLPGGYQSALNRESVWEGHKAFHCTATSLFISLVTRSSNAVFASGATAIHGFAYFDQN